MYKKYTLEYAVRCHFFFNKSSGRIFIVGSFLFLENKRLYSNKRLSESAKLLIHERSVLLGKTRYLIPNVFSRNHCFRFKDPAAGFYKDCFNPGNMDLP